MLYFPGMCKVTVLETLFRACSDADNTMYTCCLEKNRNITLTDDGETYLPEEAGNITILYDVTQSYENNYMAMVSDARSFLRYLILVVLVFVRKKLEFVLLCSISRIK